MVKKSVEIELKANARAAKRELDKVAKAAKDVDDSFDDVESAGKRMAKAIDKSADDMIDEIDATKRAVEQLERALGPDFDADPREVVADLKAIGLTAADIEADADELAAALKRIDEVKLASSRAGFDDLGQSVGKVREEQNRAQDATNSFVGNALSEIPGVSETFGPLSESVSQMTEGLLAGEIGFKDLARAAGPIAGVGGAVVLVTKALQSMAETDAFNEEQAQSFRDVIDEIGASIEAVNRALDDARAIEGRAGGVFGKFFESTVDIVPVLRELGIEQDTVNEAIANGGPALDALIDRLQDAEDAAAELALAEGDTATYLATSTGATSRYADAIEVLRETADNYAGSAADAAEDTAYFGEQADDTRDKVDELRDAFAELKDGFDDRDSFLDVADAFDAVEEASNDAWLAAATGSEDADRAARDYERTVNDAKRRVLDYADAVGNVPDSAVSEIIALIDEGALSTAQRRLDELERTRQARVNVTLQVTNPNVLRRAGMNDTLQDRGGPVGSGRTAIVAERRPEFVNGQLVTTPTRVAGPAQVTSGAQTESMLTGAGRGGNTFVTVMAPAGVDLEWLTRQQYRRTGRPV